MFVKGEHERCFAYAAKTACDRHNFILGFEVGETLLREKLGRGLGYSINLLCVPGRDTKNHIYDEYN